MMPSGKYSLTVFLGILIHITVISAQQCSGQANPTELDTDPRLSYHAYTWAFATPSFDALRSDNSGALIPLTKSGNNNTYNFPIGSTTVYASDGGTLNCTFIITVTDREKPVISDCPTTGVTATLSETVSWTAPTASDNSGVFTLTLMGRVSDAEFPLGNTTIIYTASDPYGNTEVCVFVVTVTDDGSAQINGCPSTVYANTLIGEETAAVLWTEPTSPTAGVTVESNKEPGSDFVIGITVVIYTFTTMLTNKETECLFYVIVSSFTDNTVPVISCPENINQLSELNTDFATVSWDFTMPTDNVAIDTYEFSHVSGSSFGIGTTTVFFFAIDTSGNQNECIFTVTVTGNTDNQKPTFVNCPQNVAVFVRADVTETNVNWSPPTVFDENSRRVQSNLEPPLILPVAGSPYAVYYEAVDAANNVAYCNFTITVQVDDTDPIVTCPTGPIIIYIREAMQNQLIVVNWTDASVIASDNSGQVSLVKSHNSGSSFPVGDNQTVTYTASDIYGRTSSCTFSVSIIVDLAPVFTNCDSQTINTDTNLPTAYYPPKVLMVTDMNPQSSGSSYVLSEPSVPLPHSFPIGIHEITYTATDQRMSVTTCVITLTVVDNEPPIFTYCDTSSMTVPVKNSTFRSATVTWVEPVATDNSGDVTVTSNISPGSIKPVGVYTVIYVASDGAGLSSTCIFHVTIVDLESDNTGPVISNCPVNIMKNNVPGENYFDVTWTEPSVMDDVDANPSFVSSHSPGDRFDIGDTTVSYTAIDSNKNQEVCTFVVTVYDHEIPVFEVCPNTKNIFVRPTKDDVLVKIDDILATDNSGTLKEEFDQVRVSTTTSQTINTFYATDPYGNRASCEVTVDITKTIEVFEYPGVVQIDRIRGSTTVPADLLPFQSDFDDLLRGFDLSEDFVGVEFLADESAGDVLSYKLAFYNGPINNPQSERGRFTSRTIEEAFTSIALSGSTTTLFETNNSVATGSFKLSVCEFRGKFNLISSTSTFDVFNITDLNKENSASGMALRKQIHRQLDRTYGAASIITSNVLPPFFANGGSSGSSGIDVNFVLVFNDKPTASIVNQLFERQYNVDGTNVQLDNSELYIASTASTPYEIFKGCGCNYCQNGGSCTVNFDYRPMCTCTADYTGPMCATLLLVPKVTSIDVTIVAAVAGSAAFLLVLLLCCCGIFFFMFRSRDSNAPRHKSYFEEPVSVYEHPAPNAIAYGGSHPRYVDETMVIPASSGPHPPEYTQHYGPEYRQGPIIEELDSYAPYKRDYLQHDPYY